MSNEKQDRGKNVVTSSLNKEKDLPLPGNVRRIFGALYFTEDSKGVINKGYQKDTRPKIRSKIPNAEDTRPKIPNPKYQTQNTKPKIPDLRYQTQDITRN